MKERLLKKLMDIYGNDRFYQGDDITRLAENAVYEIEKDISEELSKLLDKPITGDSIYQYLDDSIVVSTDSNNKNKYYLDLRYKPNAETNLYRITISYED